LYKGARASREALQMRKEAKKDPRSKIHRRDRGKDDAWIRSFVKCAPYGFLATVDENAQPFLNSNLFVYHEDQHCIYIHTHRTGQTRKNIQRGEKVAFSSAIMGRFLPAAEALEFSVEYASVTAFETGRIVKNKQETRSALQMLLDKYSPHLKSGTDYRPITDNELARTAVYRIDIETWSGKQKEVEPNFPGAYELPSLPVPFPTSSGSLVGRAFLQVPREGLEPSTY
jgi:nitroimidazol reductase NimA-like FMN-containing flavoprotein (pyridoxamine 5'-phosphate oxidase superfamily)